MTKHQHTNVKNMKQENQEQCMKPSHATYSHMTCKMSKVSIMVRFFTVKYFIKFTFNLTKSNMKLFSEILQIFTFLTPYTVTSIVNYYFQSYFPITVHIILHSFYCTRTQLHIAA